MFKIVNSEGETLKGRWKYLLKAKERALKESNEHGFIVFAVMEHDTVIYRFCCGKRI
jgi:hypothetical protein